MENKLFWADIKMETEEERKLKGCHYPTPDIHRCPFTADCEFNDPAAENYLKECTCCKGYCSQGDDGEECRCEQISRLL